MTILVGCEESQEVTKAFRELGIEAFSCDTQKCSGGHPEWHIQGNIENAIIGGCYFLTESKKYIWIEKWDAVIAFPPCTHLTSAGAVYWPQKKADGRQMKAIELVKSIWNSGIKYIAIENPTGILSTVWQKPTQIINPYLFGDPYRKRTCLWLKNLPALEYKNNLFYSDENIVEPIASWHSGSTRGGIKKDGTRTKSKLPALHSSSKMRSKTFPGIAKAMAEQWGKYLNEAYSNQQ